MAGQGRQHLTTLHELLDDQGIELHEIPRAGGKEHGGSRSRLYCPECGGGRQKERNFFVRIDSDGQGFTYFCHRASCGVTGGRRLEGAPPISQRPPRVYKRPLAPEEIHRPDTLLTYFAGFGISAATVQAFGVHRTTRRMPRLNAEGREIAGERSVRPVIAYPYREDGALLNVKYKAIYQNAIKRFSQEADAEPSLYNIDAFTDPALGIFVEGEDDALAVFECGFHQVTSLVDGSPAKISEHYDPATDDDQRYVALRGNTKIAALKKIILAGDMDQAGRNHHEEIARRVGKERCWVVSWPDDCKDAKETLTKRGRDAVRFAIQQAAPFPLSGIEVVSDDVIRALHAGMDQARLITGINIIDQRIALDGDDGQLIITTGIPGHGKSAFWAAMASLYTERSYEEMKRDPNAKPFHTVLFSAEMPNRRLAADFNSHHRHQPFFPNAHAERMTVDEALETHRTWVNQNMSFIHWPNRAEQPTVSWLLETTRLAVRRTGAKLVIWDPWQEIDDEMPATWRRPHSDWVGKVMQRMIGLAVEEKTNIVLVVHPPKPKERNKDGSYPIPGGYDIGGSQNFYSRATIGLTIHRPDFKKSDMLLRCWKTKDRRFAQIGDTVLRFDPKTMRIWPVPVEVDALGEAVPHWQDDFG